MGTLDYNYKSCHYLKLFYLIISIEFDNPSRVTLEEEYTIYNIHSTNFVNSCQALDLYSIIPTLNIVMCVIFYF